MPKLGLFSKFLAVVALVWALFTALPNVLPYHMQAHLPDFLPAKTINLGLDLQGGAHLLLEVDTSAVLKRATENLEDEVRRELQNEKIGYINLRAQPQQQRVSLQLRDEEEQPQALASLRTLNQATVDVEGQTITLQLTADARDQLLETALQQTVQVLRTRVDAFGVAEPVIQRQGDKRVIVQLPGIDDIQRAKDAIGKTAQLTFHLVDDQRDPAGAIPPNREVYYEESAGARYPLVVHRRPALTGEHLTGASNSFDQMGQPAVDLSFNSIGTRIFAKLSTNNVNRRFAIILDGEVLSAPVFREPILGGRAQITGDFTVQEARDLAVLLNAGALPAPIETVEERTVGPSLGADSVEAGKTAIILGFILVLVLMLAVYRKQGLAANVALLANVLLVLAIMTYVGFTLTLPGMAGLVLTIGMAVDANVLIFERIREERAAGRKPYVALQRGFEGVFSTIMDANITTLIAAVVLFAMGSGPIQGFALTLSVGILTSMFTAIVLTRWLLTIQVRRR